MKRKIIINADDLGINAQRSHGIFLSYEQGILTSTSLLANGNDSDDAARRAMERDLPTGLHLNLTEGSPLSHATDIPSLLTTDGYFLGRESLRRSMHEGEIDPSHIERETRAQIEWFLEHRGQPTHVDGHHAIHVHPHVVPVLIPLLDMYCIAFVPVPSEPAVPFGYEIDPKKSHFIDALSKEAEAARLFLHGNGIRTPENFRGLALSGRASMRNLRHTLNRLPEGVTHLAMHPGSPSTSADPFESDPQRQTELHILLNEDSAAEMKDRKIILCSYLDLL